MSQDSHHILPWYDYDEVHRLEIRKGSEKVDKFYGYESEEDIKRKLREVGQHGTFIVLGIDDEGRYLPERGEVVVPTTRGKLSNFLKSSHFKSTGPAKTTSGVDPTILLEHEAQTRRELEAVRRAESEKVERKLESARAREEAAREEEKARMEEIHEDRLRLEQEAREQQVALAHDRLTSQREAQENALKMMREMFEQKAASQGEMSQRNETVLTQVFSGQVVQAQHAAEGWKARCETLERDNRRLYDELRDKAEEGKEALRAAEKAERAKLDDRVRELEKVHAHDLEREKQAYERLQKENKRLDDKVRELEMEANSLAILSKVQTAAGPSKHVKDLQDLMQMAVSTGVDPSAVLKNHLGWDDVTKEEGGLGQKILENALPQLLASFSGGGQGQVTPQPAQHLPPSYSGGIQENGNGFPQPPQQQPPQQQPPQQQPPQQQPPQQQPPQQQPPQQAAPMPNSVAKAQHPMGFPTKPL